MVELVCVPPSETQTVWPHVKELIRGAAKRGGADFSAIERDVLAGPDLLWLAWDGANVLAAAITSLGTINDEKTCTIVACGGSGWSRFGCLIAGLEKFAKNEGCTAMRINGRVGWSRALDGYRTESVILRKAL